MNWRQLLGLEKRADNYAEAVVQLLQAQAVGDVPGDPSSSAALEIAAGLWSRGFASASVSPVNTKTESISPGVLSAIGRGLVRDGECVFGLDVVDGELRLLEASTWDVSGGPDPKSWNYRLSLPGPSRTDSRVYPGASVLHFRFSHSRSEPWKGISPLQWSSETGKLSASLERRLGEEAGGAVGYLLPVPSDGGEEALSQLRRDLGNLGGKTALVETTAGGWYEGKMSAPKKDWLPQRLGANIPTGNVSLRLDVFRAVLSACGVPPSLADTSADGTAQREAWRRFLHGTLQPVSRVLEEEIRRKLDSPFSLNFKSLMASDLAGRARAFGALVKEGDQFNKQEAAEICGFSLS